MMSVLQLRLQHCLQTILDLEPRMEAFPMYAHFQEGMSVLKSSLTTVHELHVTEDDVLRFEQATVNFIDEMWLPLQRLATLEAQSTNDALHDELSADPLCVDMPSTHVLKRVLQ